MLAGFERPTSGSITLGGRSVDGLPPYERNIGMVFQNYVLFPHMTVAENVGFPLSVRKVAKSEIGAKVKRALEMVRLEQFGERRPAQLSGGQQQRVALAWAHLILPSALSGAAFAFVTSFDEVVVIQFLASAGQRTLPLEMFIGLREQLSPAIIAAATLTMSLSILLLVVANLLTQRARRRSAIASE